MSLYIKLEKEKLILNVTLKKQASGDELHAGVGLNPSTDKWLFEGDPSSPFLAPRGVFSSGQNLLVSDTGRNRVFIWHEIPQGLSMAPADIVLGQSDSMQTGRNRKGSAAADTLQYPSGIWTDGQRLVVADAWNHRVLIWQEFPTKDGQPADLVLGQPDFESNLPNVLGPGAAPTASCMNWPYGVFGWNGLLFVADTGNRRVLVYENWPTSNFQQADYVIGKTSFEDRDYDPINPIWPYSVKLSYDGRLAITDTQYYRVMVWNSWEEALQEPASIIIGQEDFEKNGQNQFGLQPGPNTLNWCYDACFYKNGLWVADTGNSRVLWFNTIPNVHNAKATHLIGKPDFYTGSEFSETVFGTHKSLYWPFAVAQPKDSNLLLVADTGNHRIACYRLNV